MLLLFSLSCASDRLIWKQACTSSCRLDENACVGRKCLYCPKLGSAGSPGLPWILLRLPLISAGSPKMYWFLYTTPIGSFWRCNWAPGEKKHNFEPWLYMARKGPGVEKAKKLKSRDCFWIKLVRVGLQGTNNFLGLMVRRIKVAVQTCMNQE